MTDVGETQKSGSVRMRGSNMRLCGLVYENN